MGVHEDYRGLLFYLNVFRILKNVVAIRVPTYVEIWEFSNGICLALFKFFKALYQCDIVTMCDIPFLLLSVYSPFTDRIGLPLHNIMYPFLPVLDVFCPSEVLPHLRLHSIPMSFLVFHLQFWYPYIFSPSLHNFSSSHGHTLSEYYFYNLYWYPNPMILINVRTLAIN